MGSNPLMKLANFYSRKKLVEASLLRIVPKDKLPYEVYGLINEFLARGGKRFRSLLALECSRLCGGKDEDALPAATAIELFHNFTLIHDDIEDGSQLRRAKPCLHITHGLPLALNAGDGLFMMVWKAALEIKQKNSFSAQQILLSAFTSVLEGQAMELAWYRQNNWDVSEDDYITMAGGKTASLIEASCQVGALLGGASQKEQELLAKYGYKVGLAFQIQDDLLNLVGEEEKYKKEIGGDIREGKRTLMVLDCLKKLPAKDASKMRKILGEEKTTQQDIDWCIEKMKANGSIEYASKYAHKLVDDAYDCLGPFKKSQERDDLQAVARYIIDREE